MLCEASGAPPAVVVKESMEDMDDEELEELLERTCVLLFCVGGWPCDLCGSLYRSGALMFVWEQVRGRQRHRRGWERLRRSGGAQLIFRDYERRQR